MNNSIRKSDPLQLDLDAAVRTLLLPLRPGTRGEYSDRAEEILRKLGIEIDHADWVLLEALKWRSEGVPTTKFRRFVKDLLFSPDCIPKTFSIDVVSDEFDPDEIAKRFSSGYFHLHQKLMRSENISHEEASRILSHTHTIALLASGSGMTASKIYFMLSRDGIALGKGWSAVRTILDKCGFKQEIKQPEVETVYEEDSQAEADLFGDLDVEGCIQHAAFACRGFGYRGDLEEQLRILLIEQFHPPYICMVHFQLTTLTIFNHRVSNAYEFEPRGQGLLWLAERYLKSGLDVADSPFLNNAKSVDTLDISWAATKKAAQRTAARVVADLLNEFDALSEASRSASSRYLRCLFHRFIRVNLAKGGPLPHEMPVLTQAQAISLCEGIGLCNTRTTGVLEQRLSDCWLLHKAAVASDWHPKGFGDSVFATNTSRRKFGDAEIKNRVEPIIISVEAHGGHLSQIYVDDHLRTLKKVVLGRLEELEDRLPIANWTLEIHFISHSFDPGLLSSTVVEGLAVRVEYHRFADIAHLANDAAFRDLLNEHLVKQVNVVYVPARFRQAAIALL